MTTINATASESPLPGSQGNDVLNGGVSDGLDFHSDQLSSLIILAALVLLGTFATFYGVGFSPLGFICCATLLATGLYGGHILQRMRRIHTGVLNNLDQTVCDHEAETKRLHAYVDSLDSLCAQVFPVWSRQIGSSREQTEESIVELTQRFSAMVERLDQVINVSKSGTEGLGDGEGMIALFSNSQESLQSVIGSLKTT